MFAKPYDVYVFFLCLVVFTALTAMFTYLIHEIIKLTVKVIRSGMHDDVIIKNHCKPEKAAWMKITSKIISVVLCVVLVASLAFSMWLHLSEDTYSEYSSLKVVASSSMAKKHKRNTYLFENNLNTQLNMFDLIVTHPVPDEFELELYDIIVYEYDDIHIVHRIVAIEEPNAQHPDHRLFTTQGDAVSNPDREEVTYDQIKAIYRGERVEFVGSFVFFMRSPAGWLCVLLVLFAIIATPIVEKKLRKEITLRLHDLGYIGYDEVIDMLDIVLEPYQRDDGWGMIEEEMEDDRDDE